MRAWEKVSGDTGKGAGLSKREKVSGSKVRPASGAELWGQCRSHLVRMQAWWGGNSVYVGHTTGASFEGKFCRSAPVVWPVLWSLNESLFILLSVII
ncbi:MAG: hypothetical protein AB1815_01875 [Bacillota bacterium]|jgi:hypothetical protein